MFKSILLYLNENYIENQFRNNIKIGSKVSITLKKDQKTNKQTIGIVEKILTSKSRHTRGIKVRLKSGEVGRVTKILE